MGPPRSRGRCGVRAAQATPGRMGPKLQAQLQPCGRSGSGISPGPHPAGPARGPARRWCTAPPARSAPPSASPSWHRRCRHAACNSASASTSSARLPDLLPGVPRACALYRPSSQHAPRLLALPPSLLPSLSSGGGAGTPISRRAPRASLDLLPGLPRAQLRSSRRAPPAHKKRQSQRVQQPEATPHPGPCARFSFSLLPGST